MKCDLVMEKDAKAAAYQVVRYEKVQGHIKAVREGLEPQEFWDAFSSTLPNSDTNTKISKDQIDSASKSNPGIDGQQNVYNEGASRVQCGRGWVIEHFGHQMQRGILGVRRHAVHPEH